MAEDLGVSVLRLTTDQSALDAGLDKAEKDIQSKLKSLGDSLTSFGTVLSLGLTAPLVAFGAMAVQQFNDSAETAALLDNVIRSTGGTAGKTAEELKNMATSLQSKSLKEDDEIIRNVINQLLTFTQVSGDSFDRAAKSALDVSAHMGTDLQSTTIAIGKALNDPENGLAGLSRMGVRFTDEQKKLIKSLQDTGDMAGAQNIILKELEKEFGGAAEAAAKAGGGPFTQLKIQIGNASEKFGELISKALIPIVGYLARAVEWFDSLDDSTKKVILVVGGLAAAIGPVLIVVGAMASGIAAISSAAAIVVPILASIGAVLTGPVGIVIAIAAGVAALAAFAMKNKETREMVLDAWKKIKDAFKPLLDEISKLWEEHGDKIITLFKVAWGTIEPVLKTYLGAFLETLKNVIQVITGVIKLFVDALTGNWQDLAKDLLQIWKGLWNQIQEVIMAPINAIKGAVTGFTGGVKNAFAGLKDVLVDHSIVPDMIDRIGEEFGRLGEVMVKPVDDAANKVSLRFKKLSGEVETALGRAAQAFDSISDLLPGKLGAGISEGLSTAQSIMSSFASGDVFGGVTKSIAAAVKVFTSIGKGRRTANEFVNEIQVPFEKLFAQVVTSGTVVDLDKITDAFDSQASAFGSQGSTEATVVAQAHETLDWQIARERDKLKAAGRTGDTVTNTFNIQTQPGQDPNQVAQEILRTLQTDAALRASFNALWSPA